MRIIFNDWEYNMNLCANEPAIKSELYRIILNGRAGDHDISMYPRIAATNKISDVKELIVFPDHSHNGVMVKIIIQRTQFGIT